MVTFKGIIFTKGGINAIVSNGETTVLTKSITRKRSVLYGREMLSLQKKRRNGKE